MGFRKKLIHLNITTNGEDWLQKPVILADINKLNSENHQELLVSHNWKQ